MALKLYDDGDIQNIANAIRAKNGASSTQYKTSQMAAAINALTGKTVTSVDCTTTANGGFIGDANGDGAINAADQQTIAAYMVDPDIAINLDAADINGDGLVNNQDSVRLSQLLAGMTTGQILARVSLGYSDGTSETRLFPVDAPHLPDSIGKISSGAYTPSSDTTSGVSIYHGLGVIPDLIIFYTTDMPWQSSVGVNSAILGCSAFIDTTGSTTMAYRNIVLCTTSSGTFAITYASASYGINTTPNNTTFTVRCGTNYKLIGGDTYKWVAIKFK